MTVSLATAPFPPDLMILAVAVALSLCISVYLLSHRPLKRIAQYRVSKAGNIPFETIPSARIGDTTNQQRWFRGTLSFAIEPNWVYLRRRRFLRSPAIWKIPRDKVQRYEHKDWDILIYSNDRPINAFFGPTFVAALRSDGQKK